MIWVLKTRLFLFFCSCEAPPFPFVLQSKERSCCLSLFPFPLTPYSFGEERGGAERESSTSARSLQLLLLQNKGKRRGTRGKQGCFFPYFSLLVLQKTRKKKRSCLASN